MDVPIELSRILITELGDHQIIFLREKGGERGFPIMIGINEALAIDRRVKGVSTPRPMTHELLGSVIDAMGGRLEKIVINDLHDHTFIASLFIRRGEELIEVDSRPSDAIALGTAMDTPIFVSEEVLNKILNEPGSMEDRLELLRRRLDMLGRKIVELSERLDDKAFIAQAPPPVLQQHHRQLDEMRSEYKAIEDVLKKFE